MSTYGSTADGSLVLDPIIFTCTIDRIFIVTTLRSAPMSIPDRLVSVFSKTLSWEILSLIAGYRLCIQIQNFKLDALKSVLRSFYMYKLFECMLSLTLYITPKSSVAVQRLSEQINRYKYSFTYLYQSYTKLISETCT